MRCSVCGTEIQGAFCTNCGTKYEEAQPNYEFEKFKPLLMDSTERVEAVIGNNMVQKFLATGSMENGFAVLSNKRVYFKGKCYFFQGAGICSKIEENAVDLKDVTGTGFVRNSAEWAQVLMACCALPFISFLISAFINDTFVEQFALIALTGACALLFWFLYKRYNYSVFRIAYAGGTIAFDVRWTNQQETKLFQQKLVLLKQALNDKTEENSQQKSVPELLMQYKQLMDQGVITPAEYEEKKKQLLQM